jgi:hypothetical protein
MCPQTPILSPEYSHKAGLQAVITSIPLQVRPVIQRRPRGARYNGPDHSWALGLNEDAPWEDVAAGLRQRAESCEGCPCPLCLCRNSGCGEGLERRVASMPSPQQRPPVSTARLTALRHLDDLRGRLQLGLGSFGFGRRCENQIVENAMRGRE